MRARTTDPTTSHGAACMVTQFADDHYSRILKALSIVRGYYPYGGKRAFLYFCGICWNRIRAKRSGGTS